MKESGLEGYEYFAFISYSSKDAKFANKLQRHLEAYRLPVLLSRQYPRTPRKLQPIFRDRTDLEQGNLGEMLMRGLKASKFLIVICSENSAQPNRFGKRYVDLEVESFVALNPDVNRARVIPVIYREKGGARATACIPPAVKALDLLAIDVLDKGYKQTFNQIVSRMVGIKPGILWDRWRKAAQQRGMLAAAVAFAALALVAGGSGASLLISLMIALAVVGAGSYAAWRYLTPRVVNYARFIEVNNLPVGIQQLTDEEVSHRFCHYRFTYQKGRLRKVECCNSAGLSTTQHLPALPYDDVATIEIIYDEKGLVSRHVWRDDMGNILRELQFEHGGKHDWISFRTAGGDFTAAHKQECEGEHTAVTRYRVRRNATGHITQINYCNSAGHPCADSDGSWGMVYEVDTKLGVITARHCINKQEKPCRNHFGDIGRSYTYDGKGNLLGFTHVDAQGKPMYDQGGYATLKRQIDEWGNCTETSYHAADGKLCMSRNLLAIERNTYNEHGFIVRRACFDASGTPCMNSNQISIAEYELNKNGAMLSLRLYEPDGKPCLGIGQYHSLKETTDEFGRCCSQTYYDTEGKRTRKAEGYSKKEYRYDEEGRIRAELHYDEQDKPCRYKGLYFMVCRVYDEYDNACEQAWYDVDESPCFNEDGVCRIVREFDEHHNCLSETCYGADERPCRNPKTGVCTRKWDYDKNNNQVKESNYGPDSRPCCDRHGVAVKEWSYNDLGQQTAMRVFNTTGAPALNDEGFHRVEWENDTMGNHTKTATYDTIGNLSCGTYPFAVELRTYNEAGYITSRRYLDEKMHPCANEGEVMATYEYDTRHNLICERTYDENETPTEDADGVAEYRYEYDERNRKTRVTYYDSNGLPTCGPNDVAGVRITYDDRGYPICHAYEDAAGSPCLCAEGYAAIQWEHNSMGQDTAICYFDTQGNPMEINGIACVSREYDALGNCLGGKYTNAQGAPTVNRNSGVAAYRCEYDARNNKVKEQCYGTDGKPCLNHNGTSIEEWTYNEFRQRTSVSYRDTQGAPCLCADGYACKKTIYDAMGRQIGIEFYGTDGKLCRADNPPVARLTRSYDRQNRVLEEAYYDADGTLCCITDADGDTYAGIRYNYSTDAEGYEEMEVCLFDENREPII